MFPQLASGQRTRRGTMPLKKDRCPTQRAALPLGVTQMRGEQHRRSAATDGAQKADSLCSSTVFLGVSLARRLAVQNLLLRVAACLPVRGVTCATGGGSQAACVCRGSSSSTRRRSAAIIISICLDSRHWLSLLVCVLVQVIYGVSGVSGHFGDVVLWELNPPAAGEVLIRAGGHPRLLCGSWIFFAP